MPEGEAPDLAEALLGRARADAVALSKLRNDPDVDDAIVGFHAQQAVEKAVKAVLAAHAVDFPFVHDIARLIDLLPTPAVDPPPDADAAAELSPWAAELRYGQVVVEDLDRSQLTERVDGTIDWAERQIEKRPAAEQVEEESE